MIFDVSGMPLTRPGETVPVAAVDVRDDVREPGGLTLENESAVPDRIHALERRVNELTSILDAFLYELEEGTHPRRAAMIARDFLEDYAGELETSDGE
jgi:hypothetical protein